MNSTLGYPLGYHGYSPMDNNLLLFNMVTNIVPGNLFYFSLFQKISPYALHTGLLTWICLKMAKRRVDRYILP